MSLIPGKAEVFSVARSIARALKVNHRGADEGHSYIQFALKQFRQWAGEQNPLEITRRYRTAQSYHLLLTSSQEQQDLWEKYGIGQERRLRMEREAARVGLKLPQNLCRRDPESYKDDFLMRWQQFLNEVELFKLDPARDSRELEGLLHFISHVSYCYRQHTSEFPGLLMRLLEEYASQFSSGLRHSLVRALLLLRKRGQVDIGTLFPLLFGLFRVPDKELRAMLEAHIVSDVRALNRGARAHRLNRQLQGYLHTVLDEGSDVLSRQALSLVVRLYRKGVWTDAGAVNLVARAVLSRIPVVRLRALQFFVRDLEIEDSDEEDDGPETAKDVRIKFASHAKKTRSREKKMEKRIRAVATRGAREGRDAAVNWPAIELLNDPQRLCERVLAELKATHAKFEIRLLMMKVLSRFIACHKAVVLPWYTYCRRYMRVSQREVTEILALIAQSVHDLVPPEEVEPLLTTIAHEFISDRNSVLAITIGLNTVREICVRQPHAISQALLQDLVMYRKYRGKGVSNAAKGILQLYREVNPDMLQGKHRQGKKKVQKKVASPFGALRFDVDYQAEVKQDDEESEDKGKEKEEQEEQEEEDDDGEEFGDEVDDVDDDDVVDDDDDDDDHDDHDEEVIEGEDDEDEQKEQKGEEEEGEEGGEEDEEEEEESNDFEGAFDSSDEDPRYVGVSSIMRHAKVVKSKEEREKERLEKRMERKAEYGGRVQDKRKFKKATNEEKSKFNKPNEMMIRSRKSRERMKHKGISTKKLKRKAAGGGSRRQKKQRKH